MRKFSVLMSVYSGDSLEYFDTALKSISIEQKEPPSEIILVVDGPLTESINSYVRGIESNGNIYGVTSNVIRLPINNGLAKALNIGLKYCKSDWILRMDSDDISDATRIQKTNAIIDKNPSASMVGFSYRIFDTDPDFPYSQRFCPDLVDKNCRKRFFKTPINHPTIAFKKEVALALGGYPDDIGRFEDWGFALRFVNSDYQIINNKISVLSFRGPKELMLKRGGWKYLIEEINALFKIHLKGLIPLWPLIVNLIIRMPTRLLPLSIRRLIYSNFIWKKYHI